MAAPLQPPVPGHAQFIAEYRVAVTALLAANNTFQSLRDQYVALSLATELTSGDFADGNSDITLPWLLAAVTSVETIRANFLGTQMTNLYRVKK